MKMIAEVEFRCFYPLILDCRLYAMERGDILTVQTSSRDKNGDLPLALAKDLIMRRIVRAVGVGNDGYNSDDQSEEPGE